MADNVSPAALSVARELMLRALEAPNGVRIDAKTKAGAIKLRRNCYTVRTQDRKASEKMHPVGSPQRGTSDYDNLECQIEDETKVVVKKMAKAEELVIEEF